MFITISEKKSVKKTKKSFYSYYTLNNYKENAFSVIIVRDYTSRLILAKNWKGQVKKLAIMAILLYQSLRKFALLNLDLATPPCLFGTTMLIKIFDFCPPTMLIWNQRVTAFTESETGE